VNQDIDFILRDWEYKPGMVQPRLVQTHTGRQVIQMRVELGVLQIETSGRPDGASPHGFPTYFNYLQEQARMAQKSGHTFVLGEEQCQEADREFVQYYHRRMCWLQLRQWARALADADHTIGFMDFVALHSPSDEYRQAHEQYRGLVLFQRTQAAAALEVEKDNPEGAIDEVRNGLELLRVFFAGYDLEGQMEEDGMVQHLRQIETNLRQQFNIQATLQEQLAQAVANEDYEQAARIRDALRRKSD
jgi:UvrB/uvrC motif